VKPRKIDNGFNQDIENQMPVASSNPVKNVMSCSAKQQHNANGKKCRGIIMGDNLLLEGVEQYLTGIRENGLNGVAGENAPKLVVEEQDQEAVSVWEMIVRRIHPIATDKDAQVRECAVSQRIARIVRKYLSVKKRINAIIIITNVLPQIVRMGRIMESLVGIAKSKNHLVTVFVVLGVVCNKNQHRQQHHEYQN